MTIIEGRIAILNERMQKMKADGRSSANIDALGEMLETLKAQLIEP